MVKILALNINTTNLATALSGLITGAIIPCIQLWRQSRKSKKREVRTEENSVIKILREQIGALEKRVEILEWLLEKERIARHELIQDEAGLRMQVNLQKEQLDKLQVSKDKNETETK